MKNNKEDLSWLTMLSNPPEDWSVAVRAVLGLPRHSRRLRVAGLLGLPSSVLAFPANINLAFLDGTNDFKLSGVWATYGARGTHLRVQAFANLVEESGLSGLRKV